MYTDDLLWLKNYLIDQLYHCYGEDFMESEISMLIGPFREQQGLNGRR